MSAKGGIHRDHGPFVAKMMKDIEEAKAGNDELFISTPRWLTKQNSRSFGQDLVRNMNNAKQSIERENEWVKGRIISDEKLLAEHIEGQSPDDDYIGELQYRISSNTQKITENKLRLSQLDTELAEMLKGWSKKRSKKYRKSNKRTYRRRRVRKTKTQRTRI